MYDDNDSPKGSKLGTIIGLMASVAALIFSAGIAHGFLEAIQENNQAYGVKFWAIMTTIILFFSMIFVIIIYLARRIWEGRNPEPLTRLEKRNRLVMNACFALGAAIGLVLSLFDSDSGPDFGLLSDGPVPQVVALLLAIALGVIMPAIAWYWHNNAIDEQEEAAYKDGAFVAAYAYVGILPIWWILWRGGLLPPINGIAVYFIFNFIWLSVWMWKKYR